MYYDAIDDYNDLWNTKPVIYNNLTNDQNDYSFYKFNNINYDKDNQIENIRKKIENIRKKIHKKLLNIFKIKTNKEIEKEFKTILYDHGVNNTIYKKYKKALKINKINIIAKKIFFIFTMILGLSLFFTLLSLNEFIFFKNIFINMLIKMMLFTTSFLLIYISYNFIKKHIWNHFTA